VKRLMVCGLLAALIALGGCMIPLGPVPDPEPQPGEMIVRLLATGAIYAPRINNRPFGWQAVQPGEKLELDWSGGADQAGNPSGLSDPVRWKMVDVRVQCDAKTVEDTIFWPSGDFPVPYIDLDCVWFPGWTAPIEQISNLPMPFLPLSGYPWSPCRTVGDGADPMPSQQATITATARAAILQVEFVCPEREGGAYQLDLIGTTPAESNVIRYHVSEPGTYAVIWREDGGAGEERFEVEIPADWFWLVGTWRINVAPSNWGACRVI
jgi:hypothetical protein